MRKVIAALALLVLASPAFADAPYTAVNRCRVDALGPQVYGTVLVGKACNKVAFTKVTTRGSCAVAITAQGRKYTSLTLPKPCAVVTVTKK